MKSLNTKKIVAMATGAALLGSALLGAVSYQNTELINDNGAPMAKVVVGSNAHISDGVAAANIAAVLGNMAFKSVEVTATPTGINGLSCDVSGDSAGTCSVLSKSVDLEVVTPAGVIPAGAYGFSTLIGDYIDANLENRDNTNPNDEEETPFSAADEAARKVGAADLPSIFGDFAVKDYQSSITGVEKQALYIKHDGAGRKVFYDSASNKQYFVAERIKMAYEIEFETPGIPVCSDSMNSYWAYCSQGVAADADSDKEIANHRVEIMFLGQKWIISDMDAPNITSSGHGDENTGGSIKLAKEDAYSPKLQIGEDLSLGDGNKLVLGDLKPASGGQQADIAIFSVLNAAGEEIASKTVAAGATTEITAGSATYRVRVYQVAPGYTLTEKWAEVAVFRDEIELKHNQNLDDDNDDWKVTLTWRDEGTNSYNAAWNDYADHLIGITLYQRNADDMEAGESKTVIEDPALWRFTFTGLDLSGDDYFEINFDIEDKGTSFYNLAMDDVSDAESADELLTGDNVTASDNKVIRISSDEKVFRVYDKDNKRFETDEIIISPFGYTNYTDAYFNTSVFVADYDGDLIQLRDGTTVTYTSGGKWYDVKFALGDDTTAGAYGNVDNTYEANLTDEEEVIIRIEEDIGNNQNGWLFIRAAEIAVATGELEFLSSGFVSSDTISEKITYQSDTSFANGTHEAPMYTERGSKVLNADEDNIELHVSEKIGKMSFMLQSTGATESEAGAMLYPNLKEGDSINVLGATIKVKAIDVEVGPCTSTTGAGSVTGIEGIACTINANVANLGERQNIPTDLVIMDKAATNVETVIAVGGPMVNDVTAALFPAENPLQGAGDVYIAEVAAGKIVVAGYTADDTMDAAMNFIATLRGQ